MAKFLLGFVGFMGLLSIGGVGGTLLGLLISDRGA